MNMFKIIASLLALVGGLVTSKAIAEPITVAVQYIGIKHQTLQIQTERQARLAKVLEVALKPLSANQQAQINWSTVRLTSDTLKQQFDQRKKQLSSDLKILESYWERRYQTGVVQTLNKLRRTVNKSHYIPSFYMGIEPSQISVDLQKNPMLSRWDGNQFILYITIGDDPLKTLLAKQRFNFGNRLDAANKGYDWLVSNDGTVSKQPSVDYTANERPICYEHSVYNPVALVGGKPCHTPREPDSSQVFSFPGIDTDYLINKEDDINQRIMEVVKFAVGENVR